MGLPVKSPLYILSLLLGHIEIYMYNGSTYNGTSIYSISIIRSYGNI